MSAVRYPHALLVFIAFSVLGCAVEAEPGVTDWGLSFGTPQSPGPQTSADRICAEPAYATPARSRRSGRPLGGSFVAIDVVDDAFISELCEWKRLLDTVASSGFVGLGQGEGAFRTSHAVVPNLIAAVHGSRSNGFGVFTFDATRQVHVLQAAGVGYPFDDAGRYEWTLLATRPHNLIRRAQGTVRGAGTAATVLAMERAIASNKPLFFEAMPDAVAFFTGPGLNLTPDRTTPGSLKTPFTVSLQECRDFIADWRRRNPVC